MKYLDTPSGRVPLPAFFPDATHAAVRAASFADVEAAGLFGLEMNSFQRIDFLDDRYGIGANGYHEEPIGKIGDMALFAGEYSFAVIAIGNPEVRINLLRKIEEETLFKIPAIISPRAYVSPSAQVQRGAVIEPLAGIHANTIIGAASYISMGAIVNHNAIVSEGCHICLLYTSDAADE